MHVGSGLRLGSNAAPSFKQLANCEEYTSIVKIVTYMDTYNKDRQPEFSMLAKPVEELPKKTEVMIKDVRDLPTPGGVSNNLTLGGLLIDEMPLISKMMLEEIFET
ncbi:hypothetical protein EDD11_005383 [Mortierella claussenii]|nr:hypothetical protein EDD11_005383 [Mortierella claussenii]